jgi:hypothetical protein
MASVPVVALVANAPGSFSNAPANHDCVASSLDQEQNAHAFKAVNRTTATIWSWASVSYSHPRVARHLLLAT